MENKHPEYAFGVVAKGRGEDKNDQDKRGKIMLLLIEILFCVVKSPSYTFLQYICKH